MVTEEQEQLEYEAAYELEEEIKQGRWKGISKEDLCILSNDPGVFIEVNLDKYIKGLRLSGLPNFSEDGKYLIQLVMEDRDVCKDRLSICKAAPQLEPSNHPYVICDSLFDNHIIYTTFESILKNMQDSFNCTEQIM